MTTTEHIAAEFQRRKEALEAAGYKIDQYGFETLLIVEMLVQHEQTGETLVRKQEGVAFQGRTAFVVESRKLMALERLTNVVPQMCAAREVRSVASATKALVAEVTTGSQRATVCGSWE